MLLLPCGCRLTCSVREILQRSRISLVNTNPSVHVACPKAVNDSSAGLKGYDRRQFQTKADIQSHQYKGHCCNIRRIHIGHIVAFTLAWMRGFVVGSPPGANYGALVPRLRQGQCLDVPRGRWGQLWG